MSRRAKIVCTLGPATSSAEQITALVESGMDVARLNFSHGAHADHEAAYRLVREASDRTGRAVAVLADLQGPKIRLGRSPPARSCWATGSRVCITVDDVEGTAERVSTTYKDLANDVRVGDRLLVDDGKVALSVVERRRAPTSGAWSSRAARSPTTRGCRCPASPSASRRCRTRTSRTCGSPCTWAVDFIALSFVRSPDDVELVRDVMDQEDISVPVIAKMEKPEAVENLEAIVEAFDGLMVARGDLGVELPLEQVPLVQKRAVQVARERNKPVIVATQMLESMISSLPAHPRRGLRRRQRRPRRRRRGDAVGRDLGREVPDRRRPDDGTDHRRGRERPGSAACRQLDRRPRSRSGRDRARGQGHRRGLDVRALATFTQTGETARRLAALHPRQPLLAFTVDARVRSQLALSWGVETFLVPVGAAHRRHGPAGRLLAAVDRPAQGGRPGGRRRRQPAQHRGLDQPDPRARGGHRLVSDVAGWRAAADRAAHGRARPGGARPRRLRRPDPQHPPAADLRRPGRRAGADGRLADGPRPTAGCTRCTPTSCGPGDPHEEIRYAVERLRDGRSFTTRRVVAWQRRKGEDVAIFTLTADFTAGEAPLVEHALPMPDVPGPDGLPGIPEMVARTPTAAQGMRVLGSGGRAAFPGGPVRQAAQAAPATRRATPGCGSPAGCPTTRRCRPPR